MGRLGKASRVTGTIAILLLGGAGVTSHAQEMPSTPTAFAIANAVVPANLVPTQVQPMNLEDLGAIDAGSTLTMSLPGAQVVIPIGISALVTSYAAMRLRDRGRDRSTPHAAFPHDARVFQPGGVFAHATESGEMT